MSLLPSRRELENRANPLPDLFNPIDGIKRPFPKTLALGLVVRIGPANANAGRAG